MPANLENSAVATGLKKVSFHLITRKSNSKECLNYCTIALISHANKVMLKVLQARLQQYVNRELPDVYARFIEKAEETSNCQHPLENSKSKRVPEKYLLLLH